jgi:glyoxylase I family protein
MPITEAFAGVAVADFDVAQPWYERLFGRPSDMVPHDREAVWQLTPGGWIYVVADPDRAGSGLLTLLVDDLDAQVAQLAARGLDAGDVETLAAGAMRRAVIADAEGNRITFAAPAGASDADAAGRQERMTPDDDDRSVQQTEAEMAVEADRMQARLDELGEHAEEASKKAQVTREQADLDADEPLGDVAGDWEDTASTEDDPTGAVDEPQDAER